MPISLTFSEGVLSPAAISQAVAQITDSLLKHPHDIMNDLSPIKRMSRG